MWKEEEKTIKFRNTEIISVPVYFFNFIVLYNFIVLIDFTLLLQFFQIKS